MIRVSSIESNWKGTPSVPVWTATLGQATVLTGPNGGGKSKVCEAIELALTGRVSQFAGRKSVKDPKTLWRAKPKGKGGLFIELTLSDGRTVRWQQDRSNGKPRQTIDGELWVGQAGETPSRTSIAPSSVHLRFHRREALSGFLHSLGEAGRGVDAPSQASSFW